MSGLPGRFVLKYEDDYILDPQLQGEHEYAAAGSHRSAAVFTFVGGVLRSNGGKPLGRYIVEDRSLLPKRVLFLNSGDETFGETELEPLGDDRYIIKAGGMFNLLLSGISSLQLIRRLQVLRLLSKMVNFLRICRSKVCIVYRWLMYKCGMSADCIPETPAEFYAVPA